MNEEDEVDVLVRLVKDAWARREQLRVADQAYKEAVDRLVAKVGGERLAAIYNAQLRIGVLLTRHWGQP